MEGKSSTVTITFGDQAENHVGMQKLGVLSERGFTLKEMDEYCAYFREKGFVVESTNLDYNDEHARILIVRDGARAFVDPDDLIDECLGLDWDSKAKMYGRVVNKHARHNLCFNDEAQEPDYENGKGRIVAFSSIPFLQTCRDELVALTGKALVAEGNYYYDVFKCGIGYHGDSERRIVIAIRLGNSMPLYYQWYHYGKAVGERYTFDIYHGDIYFMSEKAVGTDWKKKTIPTLRHAAGAKKYAEI